VFCNKNEQNIEVEVNENIIFNIIETLNKKIKDIVQLPLHKPKILTS
jgi:hypothetical protein